MNAAVPTAMSLPQITLLDNVLLFSATSITTGDIAANFVPIKTVVFALH